MDHYGINDKNDMAALALALAREHVPGFEIVAHTKSTRGRKRVWNPDRLHALLESVREVRTQHKLNDRQALQFLANNQDYRLTWGCPPNRTGKGWIETLESRLQDAKRLEKHFQEVDDSLEAARAAVIKKFRKK